MNRSERIKRLQAELAQIEAQTDVPELSSDQLEQLLFRMNNIGYSLKRIADSLGDIKRMMQDKNE